MSGRRLFAICVIFVLASAAWAILAGSVQVRTDSLSGRLGSEVSGLWGTPQIQAAPEFRATGTSRPVELVGTDIATSFKLDQRRKGLLWYSTYVVDFDAAYRLTNPDTSTADVRMEFTFPDSAGIYDGFAVRINGSPQRVTYADGKATARFTMQPKQRLEVVTGYRTNGMDSWAYAPSPGGASVIKDFRLTMDTDFGGFDYPGDGVSPTSRQKSGDGWQLAWDYESVVSGRNIGLQMPKPMNPGPLVARITLFAPVSLLFFFAALVLLMTTRGVKLHPIHYGFLAAAFFAFDLLLAYLADQVDINIAFAIAALTSVALVVGYLRVVVGQNRALFEIAIAQLIFLVLFSYSFFFEGFTGLAITVGAVLTLAFFMYRTAHLDWETVFAPKERATGDWTQLPNGRWMPPTETAAAPAVPPTVPTTQPTPAEQPPTETS